MANAPCPIGLGATCDYDRYDIESLVDSAES